MNEKSLWLRSINIVSNYELFIFALIFLGNGMLLSDIHTSLYLKGKHKDESMKYTPYLDLLPIITGVILFIINSI